MELHNAMQQLESAEEFFHFFGVPYDADRLKVVHLHVLKRFHEYKESIDVGGKYPASELKEKYRRVLAIAYEDFKDGLDPSYLLEGKGGCAGGCGGCGSGDPHSNTGIGAWKNADG